MANIKIFFQRFLVCFFVSCVFVCSAFAQLVVKVSVLRPSDQPVVYQHETDALRESVVQVQSFFASEMKRHGYGAKTFEFETNIPVYIGAKELSEYEVDADVVRWQHGNQLKNFPDDIHLVFLVGASQIGTAAGVFTHRCDATGDCDYRRLVVVPLEGNAENRNRVTAHELGHAFGYLAHLTTQKRYIMEEDLVITPGAGEYSLFNYQLHPEVAKTLNESNDLSVNNDVDTSKFDRIVRRPDDPEVDVNDNDNSDIDADVNDDGYVDLYDVLIVRSGMSAKSTYDTDINNDGITDEVDLAIVKADAHAAIAAAAPRKRKVNITTWGSMKSR